MDVQVVDALAAPPADVRNEPIAGVGDALGAGEVRRHGEHPPQQGAVALDEIGGRRDVATREEQDVCRRPGSDVADRDHQVVVVEPIGRDLAGHDSAEQAVCRLRHGLYHSAGFELIRNPIVPTRPAIRYDR